MLGVDVMKKAGESMSKSVMKHGFVRVYHMKDGTAEPVNNCVHITYEEALEKLWFYNPNMEEGVDDMLNVDHVTIEKRYYPAPNWID
jgi:hypothetical protein